MNRLPSCESCGAHDHGNLQCIACLRWMKRVRQSNFARVLIKLWERRVGIYADAPAAAKERVA